MKLKPHFILPAVLLMALSLFRPVAAQNQKSLLWKITGRHMAQPAYLLGTVHMFDTSLYHLPQAAFDKVQQVKKVYFELDFGKINPAAMMSSIFVTDTSQRLDKLLDAAALAKLQSLARQSPTLQALGKNMYRLKPIYLSAFLMNNGKVLSVDMELYHAALIHKDSVGGLETLQEQLNAINAIPIATQARMLSDMLNRFTSADDMIQNLTRIYARQDIDHMMQEMNEDMPLDDNFNSTLINKRNLVMDKRMEALIGTQPTLIAVGSGHLGGPDGLLALLRKHGYTLTPVPVTFVKAH